MNVVELVVFFVCCFGADAFFAVLSTAYWLSGHGDGETTEPLLTLAAIAIFCLALFLAIRPLCQAGNWRRILTRIIASTVIYIAIAAAFTFPAWLAWSNGIDARYAYEGDPMLEFSPFEPPRIADSHLLGDRWVDGVWNVKAKEGARTLTPGLIYGAWAVLALCVDAAAWFSFGRLGRRLFAARSKGP
jgi:hypothetical protein